MGSYKGWSGKYSCEECNLKFDRQDEYYYHQYSAHKSLMQSPLGTTFKFCCLAPKCQHKFATIESLTMHSESVHRNA